MKYVFFYDETEHSRKINYKTVTANNYCDNFMTGIVGWKAEENDCVSDRYLAFESKYDYRKKDGELKSQTMKTKDFSLGFASLNNHTIEFYEDLVSLFDEKIIIYFSVFSKIEYVISQLFVNYHNSMFVDVDCMKYSIIKAINVYHPQNVIEAIYKEPQVFVKELRSFLEDQIIKNQANSILIDPIVNDDKDCFYNQKGAKVYKDINKQPMLPLHSGQNEFYVLSVGFSRNGTPLVTISENEQPKCYRLPDEYGDWTMTVVGFANMGESLFPSKVLFSLINGRYLVDIL